MNRTHLAVVVGAALSALAWMLLSSGPDAAPSTPTPTIPDPVAAETSRPAPSAPALEPPVPAAQANAAPSAPAPAIVAAAASTSDKETHAYVLGDDSQERQLVLEEERRELRARSSSESADTQWSAETGARVQALIAQHAAGAGALTEVDCRQTLCRFALRSASAKHKDVKGLLSAARAIDEQTWTLPERQDDETFAIEVFFPRKDYRLSSGGGRIDEPPRMADLGRP